MRAAAPRARGCCGSALLPSLSNCQLLVLLRAGAAGCQVVTVTVLRCALRCRCAAARRLRRCCWLVADSAATDYGGRCGGNGLYGGRRTARARRRLIDCGAGVDSCGCAAYCAVGAAASGAAGNCAWCWLLLQQYRLCRCCKQILQINRLKSPQRQIRHSSNQIRIKCKYGYRRRHNQINRHCNSYSKFNTASNTASNSAALLQIQQIRRRRRRRRHSCNTPPPPYAKFAPRRQRRRLSLSTASPAAIARARRMVVPRWLAAHW